MGRVVPMIKGLGLGAGLMYFFDPDRGQTRRARARDRILGLLHELDDAVQVGRRDLSNRVRGLLAEARSLVGSDDAPDEVVVARVRSQLGRVVSHPRAIEVTARHGHVTLSGPILAHEVDNLLAAVSSVRGVNGVEDRLEVYSQPGDIPALQGGTPRTGERSEIWQQTWTPATRLLLGVAGGVLALQIARRGGLSALAVAAVGVGLASGGLGMGSMPEGLGQGRGEARPMEKTMRDDANIRAGRPQASAPRGR